MCAEKGGNGKVAFFVVRVVPPSSCSKVSFAAAQPFGPGDHQKGSARLGWHLVQIQIPPRLLPTSQRHNPMVYMVTYMIMDDAPSLMGETTGPLFLALETAAS
ncbi:hypothetical protein PG997_011166 [Apiospora hydei]|uniref:Uncharacterized protein n=1 Tax=Apiospora hydei TaxID=1337664 RepID=A0ABR1VI89_9PEZI